MRKYKSKLMMIMITIMNDELFIISNYIYIIYGRNSLNSYWIGWNSNWNRDLGSSALRVFPGEEWPF